MATTFSAEEKAAMKAAVAEKKAAQAGADAAAACEAAIAALTGNDKELAETFHQLVAENTSLAPKTWYGMPAYAKNGKNIVFFQPATKFKARYSTIGFNDPAQLDDGTMWATAFAVVELTPADEKILAALLEKAAG